MKKALAISLMLFLGVSAYPLVGCSDKNQVEKIPELPTEIVPLGEPGVQIHYRRGDGKYHQWCLWLWGEGLDGQEYKFNYKDDYGAIAYYPLSHFNNPKSLGFIVKQTFEFAGDGNWVKDGDKDRFMDIEMLEQDEIGAYHVYIQSGKPQVYTDIECQNLMNAVKTCQFESNTSILLETNNAITTPVVKKNGVVLEDCEITGSAVKKEIVLNDQALISDAYTIDVEFKKGGKVTKNVSIRKLYNMAFDSQYSYSGDLGAIYSKESTTFRVWSPISSSIKLRIYDNGTPVSVDSTKGNDTFTEYDLVKGERGVFEYTLAGDLAGKYYTYFVTNSYNPNGKEIVDPYARSAGISGKRGMIVDFSKTNPEGWEEVGYSQTDKKQLTVYETHVSDLTSSSTWNGTKENAKKFKGMIETGTTYTENKVTVKTGFDHVKELGVNAIQVIPFFDQANDETKMEFNWGYNPLNYNVVEGSYSSDPYDGYVRIQELKEVIKAYKDAGLSFIMDVVYNHVSGLTGSNFDILMPFYYFRYSETGGASSGSGCGNDTASERAMFRKFMIDSTEFWTKEYKLDGFRFDLMGLHDIDTMNSVVRNLQKVNPNIIVFGEAWIMGTSLSYQTSLANQSQAKNFKGFGQFNDKGRDTIIAGGMKPADTRAWMNNETNPVNTAGLLEMIKGQTSEGITTDPNKTVNYVSCHDNYTLHDRNIAAGIYNEEEIRNSNMIANSIVMTSQGVGFMLSGEEINRTKIEYDNDGNPIVDKKVDGKKIYKVSHNSYSSCYKTNEIDWSLKVKNLDMFEAYQKLIYLKTHVADLALNEEEIKNSTSFSTTSVRTGTIIITKFSDENFDYTAYISSPSLYNYAKDSKDPYIIDLTGKEVYLATIQDTTNKTSITLNPRECVITRSAR